MLFTRYRVYSFLCYSFFFFRKTSRLSTYISTKDRPCYATDNKKMIKKKKTSETLYSNERVIVTFEGLDVQFFANVLFIYKYANSTKIEEKKRVFAHLQNCILTTLTCRIRIKRRLPKYEHLLIERFKKSPH